MVDFVSTFIVPYVVLINLGLGVFNCWMLFIVIKKFFVKKPTLNSEKTAKPEETSEAKPDDTAATAEVKGKEKKKEKKPKGGLQEAPSMFVA